MTYHSEMQRSIGYYKYR